VSHNLKGKITMKVSMKIEKEPNAPMGLERRDRGYRTALRVMFELIRDASMSINASAAAKVFDLPSFLNEVNWDDKSLNANIRRADRVAFHIYFDQDKWILRVNVRKEKLLTDCKEMFFLASNGELKFIRNVT
jgi:hypothetical protein